MRVRGHDVAVRVPPSREACPGAVRAVVDDVELVDAGLSARLADACSGVAHDLSLPGAAVELWSGPTGDSVVAAISGDAVRAWSRLEFDIGEGPAMQAQRQGRPVLVDDLLGVEARDWPGYAIAALEAGIRAIFVVPLLVGATRFGVLVLYSGTVRHLDAAERAVVLTATDRIVALLLEHPDPGPTPPVAAGAVGFVGILDLRSEVLQAQGIDMVGLEVCSRWPCPGCAPTPRPPSAPSTTSPPTSSPAAWS